MLEENESVILVNERNEEIGSAPKLEAHTAGRLHRAFSVFVIDSDGKILLHRRADGKYHSSGLWTNACCGHPRPGESTPSAARRRLTEEMGIDCELNEAGVFTYRAQVDNDLIEHELDHVFIGRYSGSPLPDIDEVQDWQWISATALNEWLSREPSAFTVWFQQALQVSRLGTMRSSTFADDSTPGTPPPG
jgi:isopentenyl-diphosphate delta-isomerase